MCLPPAPSQPRKRSREPGASPADDPVYRSDCCPGRTAARLDRLCSERRGRPSEPLRCRRPGVQPARASSSHCSTSSRTKRSGPSSPPRRTRRPRLSRPRIRLSRSIWWCQVSVERAREQLELAEGRWERAIAEHAQPPPDPVAFARRLRALADAAAQEQAAYRYAANEGFGWRPGPPWLPPRELRPAPWREALAPPEAWERLDEAIERLSSGRTGVSVQAISQAFGGLASAAWGLAEAVDDAQRRPAAGAA